MCICVVLVPVYGNSMYMLVLMCSLYSTSVYCLSWWWKAGCEIPGQLIDFWNKSGLQFAGLMKTKSCVVSVQQWQDWNVFTISIKKYLLKFKVDILSIIVRKMRDEEVEVWKLLIANLISKHQNKMSAKKLPFSEIYIKNLPVSEFSLTNYI